jgi:redox-sensitive bicupin YhaK (pirin superfamily)
MITMRPAHERGHANHGWLDANFTFSFANYYDPKWMGFRSLRVINDDIVAPGRGFGKHPHDNMEILTYMISGSLGHNDSTGGSGAIVPGELQHMSAGTGIYHSEQNASSTEPSHSLQIWIEPNQLNVKPQYNQRKFNVAEEPNRFHLLASGGKTTGEAAGRDNSFPLYADADLFAAKLEPGHAVEHVFGRPYGWLHVVRGEVTLAGAKHKAGDGLALSNEQQLSLSTETGGEVLLFDLD